MPVPPRPIDNGGLLDPRRHGDRNAYIPPSRHNDGRVITERPWTNQRGRYIPPGRDHITIINNTLIINNMNGIQRGWNRHDHGYSWHHWNGHRISHHYDTFGYHWWGFYVGDRYFSTRYHNDRYWWYDPYWHRWVYLHDGRWWWQDPVTPTVVYVIVDDNYYRYRDDAGTVIVTPDPTPPVEAPPAEPNVPTVPEGRETMYSLDGTRSVQILGDRKEAFLYDLTIDDPEDRKAKGRWLGAGVASAKFVYDDKMGDDGTPTQAIRQIALTFDDADKTAVADLNGERSVQVSEEARSAYLYNLKDDSLDPVFLADNTTGVSLINEERQDDSGEARTRLKLVVVTARNDVGLENTLMFDRNGAPYDSSAEQPEDRPEPPAQTQLMQQKVQASPTLRALGDDVPW